jgi:hypothetical protein
MLCALKNADSCPHQLPFDKQRFGWSFKLPSQFLHFVETLLHHQDSDAITR